MQKQNTDTHLELNSQSQKAVRDSNPSPHERTNKTKNQILCMLVNLQASVQNGWIHRKKFFLKET